jgi:hypothetical protein
MEGGARGGQGTAGWWEIEPCGSGSGWVTVDLAGEELVVVVLDGDGRRVGGGGRGGWLSESLP